MKNVKSFAAAGLMALTVLASGCGNTKYAGKIELKNEIDSVSYALGYFEGNGLMTMLERMPFDTLDCKNMANAFNISKLTDKYLDMRKSQFDTISSEAFLFGFIHQVRFKKGLMNEEMANMICNKKFEEIKARKSAERDSIAAANIEIGKKFLAENATKEGVVTLESGLQYKIITKGEGKTPVLTDKVKVNYTGKLIDGTVFDSSVERGEPASFPVTGVIKGWTEALQLMPVGSKWELFIPAELAYGANGAGEKILPNSALTFEVELLSIEENN